MATQLQLYLAEHDPILAVIIMLATHPDFKSIEPKVQDAETMDFLLGHAMIFEKEFDRKVPPWELSQWGDGELETFQIEFEQVDRLYYIKPNSGDAFFEEEYYMVARMNYKGRHVFIDFQANCFNDFGYGSRDYGVITISNDGDSFMRANINEFRDRKSVV